MKKNRLLSPGILFISLLIFFTGCKKSENPTQPPTNTSSIGQLSISPNAILVNTLTTVTIHLTVPASTKLVDSTVKIIKLDANNAPTGDTIGAIYDSGKLTDGDDIKGDNIYSGIFYLTQATAGQLKIRATAQVKQGTGTPVTGNSDQTIVSVLSDLTSKELNDLATTQETGTSKLDSLLAGNPDNVPTAVAKLKTWLQGQTAVESVEMDNGSSVRIKYKSGIYGAIVISLEDVNGSVYTKGGYTSDPPRNKSSKIPLYKQTTGKYIEGNTIRKTAHFDGSLSPQIIGNRNVLIYAPFDSYFAPVIMSPSIIQILNNSGFDFSITSYSNQDANISVLSNLTDYGLVIFDTHGSGGKEFGTGEFVDTNATVYQSTYKAMLKAGKLSIWKNVTISKTGTVKNKKDVYAIRAPFISDLANTFPNSVIFNGSCESTMNPDLGNAFIGKGAKAYYGFTKVVNTPFCKRMADTVVKRLAMDLKTTGEAFMTGQVDPTKPYAVYEIKGQNDVHYADSLINGDFEYGKMYGWTKTGDGRVISQLGHLSPTGGSYMGIISTGLGFTTSTGRISQTFTVDKNQTQLTIHWNFLSEEFLTYIGSSYQDYYKVVIKTSDGVEHVLMNKTIDDIAADFGASYPKPDPPIQGNLIYVSPEIVFDQGDVYMTDWQTSTFDVSAYQGKRITLILTANDVGDSAFDTAILLDDIAIK
jgi:hypothetical protein